MNYDQAVRHLATTNDGDTDTELVVTFQSGMWFCVINQNNKTTTGKGTTPTKAVTAAIQIFASAQSEPSVKNWLQKQPSYVLWSIVGATVVGWTLLAGFVLPF